LEVVEIAPGRPARAARSRPARHLADLGSTDRRAAVAELGQPAYRADQLSRHYFGRLTESADEMTDLPATSRGVLVSALLPRLLSATRELTCDRGMTRKTLWQAADGSFVESVLMRYPGRVTMCVSSQAGCGMACPFCATGQAGLTRNLSAAEIVTQVLAAVGRLSDPVPDGFGISQRAITISTVGLATAMRRLAAEGLSARLAVSLHAPDDELRDSLVPVNRRWKVAEVLDAAWGYAAATRRRVSIEYAMIREINDQAWRAEALARLLAGRLAHVNLIPLNPTPGSKWTASEPEVAAAFERCLADRGIPVTVRDTRGREIDGACGQLAAAGRQT